MSQYQITMQSRKFFYSKWFAWGHTFNLTFPAIIYRTHFNADRPFPAWEIAIFIVMILVLINQCYFYVLPVLRGKTFAEMDNEKIYLSAKNKTIYWSDVQRVIYGDLLSTATLKLKNGKKARINLNCIQGDNSDVYETILAYFQQATDPGFVSTAPSFNWRAEPLPGWFSWMT